jgi:hypothetical protein
MDTSEISDPGVAASDRLGAAAGRQKGGRRSLTKDHLADELSFEPRAYSLRAREVTGAWIILLAVVGLVLTLTVKRMDLSATASAAPVLTTVSSPAPYPMAGVRNPGSVFYSRARGVAAEEDGEERKHGPEDGC